MYHNYQPFPKIFLNVEFIDRLFKNIEIIIIIIVKFLL